MFTGDQDDRTIAPTPRRLAEARRAGAFAHSRDFTSAFAVVAAVTAFILLAPQFWSSAGDLLRASWNAPLTRLADGPIPESVADILLRIAGLLAALLGAPLLAAVFANWLQSGFRIDVRWPQLRFSTVSPIAGLGRMKNAWGWFAIGQLAMKLAVTTGLLYLAIRSVPFTEAAAELCGRFATVSLQVAAALAALSLVDWAYRRRQFLRSLRLTPSQARQEARDSKAARRPRTGPPLRVSGPRGVPVSHARDVRPLPSDPLFS